MSEIVLNPSSLSRGPSTAKFYSEPPKEYTLEFLPADEEKVLMRVYSSYPKFVGESSARPDGFAS